MPDNKGFNIFEDMEDIVIAEKDGDIVPEEVVGYPIDDEAEDIDTIDSLEEDTVEEETSAEEDEVEEIEKEELEVTEEPIKKSKTSGSTFNTIIDFITNPIADEEWDSFKEEMLIKIDGIRIKSNIPPNVILMISSELDTIHSLIHEKYMETKTALDNLTNKEDGILYVVKTTNAKGSNETERKASGVQAAKKYKIGKNVVDLFSLIAETRGRYHFLEGLLKQIQFKKELLITVSSAIKVLNK